ncbi:MAG: esterase-like activity of phytase family protein [Rhodobacteraceae bacterium]|nr:esterase-like activity of phytase family protein [Paracoccaceae bacterium]
MVWSEADPGFGGFSGIEVQDGGATFLAIGDRGAWASGRMRRAGGRLEGVDLDAFGPLRAISGERLDGQAIDAEGLASDAEGRLYVSFESFHRIRRYDALDGPALPVPAHPQFERLQDNAGLEALAVDAGGVLYTIPERSGLWERPFPVYRFADGAWLETLSLPRSGKWLAAGADFGPDGQLYLLEREFSWVGGFATRIRRFALGRAGFHAGETLIETAMGGSTDNFEGISVWRDAAGETRITLIADDNFFPLQSTAIAEYRLVGD